MAVSVRLLPAAERAAESQHGYAAGAAVAAVALVVPAEARSGGAAVLSSPMRPASDAAVGS